MATNVVYNYGNAVGSSSGNSTLQAWVGIRIAETSSTGYRLEYGHAVYVNKGNFQSSTCHYSGTTNGSTNWSGSTNISGVGWYADNSWINAGWYSPGQTLSLYAQVSYPRSSGTVTSTVSGSYTVPGYHLDVNGLLDGSEVGNTAGYGTFNVAINGSTVSSNVTDFYTAYTPGTTYSISNIKATTGHTYNGVSSGSLSGTLNSAASVVLKFTTNTYTITYNANGGSGAPSATSYTYASSGSTNLSSTIPTRTGYTFLGWSLSSTATVASYSAGQAWALSNDSNYTLYAVWKANTYTITYNANGGSGAPASQTYTYADSGTVALSSAIPTKSGYDFLGWSTSSSATSATYAAGGTYGKNNASNVTLYAVWKLSEYCTLVYNTNGGSGTIANQKHTRNVVSTLSNIKPVRNGYSFSGWTLDNSSNKATYLAGGRCAYNDFEHESTVTLYAVWRKIINFKFKLSNES